MSFLIDTNVVSELTRQRPAPQVVAWLKSTAAEQQFLSILTLGELRFGALQVSDTERSKRLVEWLDGQIIPAYADRTLALTTGIAERWARLRVEAKRTVSALDCLIAATALHHDLRLVTRNERDFAIYPGLVVVNPWRE